jgi:hypothetical protein
VVAVVAPIPTVVLVAQVAVVVLGLPEPLLLAILTVAVVVLLLPCRPVVQVVQVAARQQTVQMARLVVTQLLEAF